MNMIEKNDLLKYREIENIILFFQEIDKIPRKSGNEKEISNYLIKFAQQRSLEYEKDQNNNVIIKKTSTNNSESFISFQSHIDMVCEKINGSNHNFSIDPIEIFIENDFIKARETSIGADNGIGVAIMLAILNSNDIKHPNLEMIFTSEEETILGGAKSIDMSNIKSNRMISLDAFSEKIINIGCASCIETKIVFENYKTNIDDLETYRITLGGFLGGHSGNDIGKNRGNPIIELAHILLNENNVYLNEFIGGNSVNSIPREVSAIVSIKKDKDSIVKIVKNISKLKRKFKNEKIILEIHKELTKNDVFDNENTKNVLEFITHFPNGEILKDPKNNYTILSSNLGKIYSNNKKLVIEYSIRSNEEIEVNNLVNSINELQENKRFFKIEENVFPGYTQNNKSDFINYLYNRYIKVFEKEPIIKEEHFLLECGYFSKKIKDLQYVSISPNIYNPHSPYESVSLSSIQRIWKVLIEVLKNI